MKTKTLERNNSKILHAHNRVVRHEGQTYLIRAQRLGPNVLADAEPMPKGGTPFNLFARTRLSQALRGLVEIGAFS